MLDDALRYSGLGWYVFPCHTPRDWPGEQCSCERSRRRQRPDYKCDSPGKHPRTSHGLDDATVNHEQIIEWWEQWPDANIGINCGKSGLFVIDLDLYKDTYQGLEFQIDEETVTSISGGGGTHLFYRLESGDMFGNAKRDLPPGIDIRAHGGYVIVAPSLHVSGRRYQWEVGCEPWS